MATSERILVTAEELRAIINARLGENRSTRDCEMIGVIRRRDEPYPDGGNWNRSVAIGGSPIDPQKCGEEAAEIVERIADEYNLA